MTATSNIIILALAVTVTAAPSGYTTISDCFTLKGINPNGTSLGVLDVSQRFFVGYYVYGVFEDEINRFMGQPYHGTKLGIDRNTGHLLDRNPGNVFEPTVPHNGLIASVTQPGVGADSMWFDTSDTTLDPAATGRVPLNCYIDSGNRLSCSHPTKQDYNVFHFCPPPADVSDIWPALRIGTAADIETSGFFGETCYAILVVATGAQGCLV